MPHQATSRSMLAHKNHPYPSTLASMGNWVSALADDRNDCQKNTHMLLMNQLSAGALASRRLRVDTASAQKLAVLWWHTAII